MEDVSSGAPSRVGRTLYSLRARELRAPSEDTHVSTIANWSAPMDWPTVCARAGGTAGIVRGRSSRTNGGDRCWRC